MDTPRSKGRREVIEEQRASQPSTLSDQRGHAVGGDGNCAMVKLMNTEKHAVQKSIQKKKKKKGGGGLRRGEERITKLEAGGGIGPSTSPGHVFCFFSYLLSFRYYFILHDGSSQGMRRHLFSNRCPSALTLCFPCEHTISLHPCEPACFWKETEAHISGR